jgi:predicted Rossmann fold nucleotide-binding protein DprA/Smf involved in DNA uptake
VRHCGTPPRRLGEEVERRVLVVADPGDVLSILETPARHTFQGSFESRYADPTRPRDSLFAEGLPGMSPATSNAPAAAVSAVQAQILEALASARTLDELISATGLSAGALRSELTLLEIQRRIRREGSRIAKSG